MSTIIKPKRATQEEIAASTKVLSKDEILLAIPNEGDHSGKLKLYRGDGITPANELPVGIDGELGDDLKISAFEESTAEENQELEAGASLSRLFGNIKRKFTQVQNETSNKVSSNGDISNTVIGSVDTITADFPEPAAGESTKTYLGKVKKFIADFNSFKNGIITLGRLANNADTTVEGFALDARMGKTLGDRVAQLNSDLVEVNSNLGKVITKSESKAAVSGTSNRLCAITLSAGHKYIILASVNADRADASSIVACQIVRVSGSYVTFVPGIQARGTMAAGGGCATHAYIHCSTDCVLDMTCYGYNTAPYNYNGNMIAICLV